MLLLVLGMLLLSVAPDLRSETRSYRSDLLQYGKHDGSSQHRKRRSVCGDNVLRRSAGVFLVGMGFRPQPVIDDNLIRVSNDPHEQARIASSLRSFRDGMFLFIYFFAR